jgi:FtsH-binding integral membrane protein
LLQESAAISRDDAQVKARNFISDVYFRMMMALLTSSAIGYFSVHSGLIVQGWKSLGRGFSLAIFVTQILTVIVFQGAVYQLKPALTRWLFGFYCVITGLTLGMVGAIYTLDSILTVALVSAAAFWALAWYGKVTKRDLGPLGSFLLAGFSMLLVYSLGVWAASFFSFLEPFLGTALTVQGAVGCVLFSVAIAYEAQRLKMIAQHLAENSASDSEIEVHTNNAALGMYMNFIGLFLSLLRLLGRRN